MNIQLVMNFYSNILLITYWFVGIRDSGVNLKRLIAGKWDNATGHLEGIDVREPEKNSSAHTQS